MISAALVGAIVSVIFSGGGHQVRAGVSIVGHVPERYSSPALKSVQNVVGVGHAAVFDFGFGLDEFSELPVVRIHINKGRARYVGDEGDEGDAVTFWNNVTAVPARPKADFVEIVVRGLSVFSPDLAADYTRRVLAHVQDPKFNFIDVMATGDRNGFCANRRKQQIGPKLLFGGVLRNLYLRGSGVGIALGYVQSGLRSFVGYDLPLASFARTPFSIMARASLSISSELICFAACNTRRDRSSSGVLTLFYGHQRGVQSALNEPKCYPSYYERQPPEDRRPESGLRGILLRLQVVFGALIFAASCYLFGYAFSKSVALGTRTGPLYAALGATGILAGAGVGISAAFRVFG